MSEKKTLGAAIDDIIAALEALEPKARATAVSAACAHLGVSTGDTALTHPPAPRPGVTSSRSPEAGLPTGSSAVVDIRTLRNEKRPRTAKDMACVVGYYLQELAPPAERKDAVAVGDIEKYFKQAGFKLPKKISQILIDAKASGYFDSAERGKYRLNAVGYNLVAHALPRKKAER